MKKFFVITILLISVLSSCTNEYIEYHSQNIQNPSQNIAIENDFKIDTIESRDFDYSITPDKKSLDKLVSKLENAQKRIYLEVYILTEKRIIKALKDAKGRGVDVRVILEKNVFGAGSMNKKSFNSLSLSGVTVKYANNVNYRFTHAKFFIIDDSYVISSGNMSYSTFAYNKDFLLYGNNQKDLILLEKIFSYDARGEKFIKCDTSLVISPVCPRKHFLTILKSATKSIYIYAENFDDDEIFAVLSEKVKSGIVVKIIIGDVTKIKSNQEAFDKMMSVGIQVVAPKKPYMHAKSIIIDDEIIYIGSINFSTNSINNNREIGVIFKNKIIIEKIENEFLTNFKN